MAILITTDGEVVDNYDASDLGKKQNAVGGYIEYVRTRLGMTFIVNEEGMLLGLKPNMLASNLAEMLLLGNVLIVSQEEIEEEDKEC
ncbi:DUF3846 domain-containing protein [bacterium]|jgi:hypothetical protein|nr:DUF3846 domain-containing protein [bacterium]